MKLTTPITITMISDALSVSNHSVGYLCSNRHGKTNKWSRFKPVCSDKLDRPLTEAELRGKDFGLRVPRSFTNTLLGYIYNRIGSTFYNWDYDAPMGGTYNEYFRMGDFIGYEHGAQPPARTGNTQSTLTVNYSNTSTITLGIDWPNLEWNGSITLNDMFHTGDYYFCIDVYKDAIADTGGTTLRASVPFNTSYPVHELYMITYNIKSEDVGHTLYFVYGVKRYVDPDGEPNEIILLPTVDSGNMNVRVCSIVSYFDRSLRVTHYSLNGLGPWVAEANAPYPVDTRNSSVFLRFDMGQKDLPLRLYSNHRGGVMLRARISTQSGTNTVIGELMTETFSMRDYVDIPVGTGKTNFAILFPSLLLSGRSGTIPIEITTDGGSSWSIASTVGIVYDYYSG